MFSSHPKCYWDSLSEQCFPSLTTKPWSFMFKIRFWPITASPIKAMSALECGRTKMPGKSRQQRSSTSIHILCQAVLILSTVRPAHPVLTNAVAHALDWFCSLLQPEILVAPSQPSRQSGDQHIPCFKSPRFLPNYQDTTRWVRKVSYPKHCARRQGVKWAALICH